MEIPCISHDKRVPDAKELEQIAHIKRFAERWSGDVEFREQFLLDPYKAVASYGLKVEPNDVSFIWNPQSWLASTTEEISLPPIIQCILEMMFQEKQSFLEGREESKTLVKDPRVRGWRKRQMARVDSQIPTESFGPNGQYPVCFELTKGCSVGCWFCLVSAARLSGIFTYTSENAKLWRQVLELMKDILGAAASQGFCYWATDPLDNPDYEKFCLDFYKILGAFPSTTTAQALKDPSRTRSLLQLSRAKENNAIRFSILSLKMLNQVHQEFSPEELTFVHLELRNKEAATPNKVDAGRARDRRKRDPQIGYQFVDNTAGSCVSGFLFNLVDRSVKLISSCIPDDRWTLGYRIHDEGTFADINQLNQLLEEMISRHMPLSVRPGDLVRFRSDLRYESLSDGFQLSTRFKSFKFRQALCLKQLGELISQGDKTAGEIATAFEILGVAPTQTFQYLNQLFERGLLDDEPSSRMQSGNIHQRQVQEV